MNLKFVSTYSFERILKVDSFLFSGYSEIPTANLQFSRVGRPFFWAEQEIFCKLFCLKFTLVSDSEHATSQLSNSWTRQVPSFPSYCGIPCLPVINTQF